MAADTLSRVLGNWETVVTPGSEDSLAAAIAAAVTAHSKLTVTASGTGYVEFRHTSGPITDARYLANGVGSGQNALGYTLTTRFYLGMAPEGGVFTPAEIDTGTGPYGVSPGSVTTLWSGFTLIGGASYGSGVSQVRILASDEDVFIVFDHVTAGLYSGCLAGAWLEAPQSSEGHKGLAERIFAISATGLSQIGTTGLWTTVSDFLSYSSTTNWHRTGCFNPNSASSASFDSVIRRETYANDADSNESTTGPNGRRVHSPLSFKLFASPHNFIGYARQIRKAERQTQVWADGESGGTYVFSPSTGSAVAAIAFDNSR